MSLEWNYPNTFLPTADRADEVLGISTAVNKVFYTIDIFVESYVARKPPEFRLDLIVHSSTSFIFLAVST